MCTNWIALDAYFPIRALNNTSDAVIQGEFKITYQTGMSTLSMQLLTEALMGTMGAHKGQNVPDPPHPNRICLKKDEDFCKTGVRFFSVKRVKGLIFLFLLLMGVWEPRLPWWQLMWHQLVRWSHTIVHFDKSFRWLWPLRTALPCLTLMHGSVKNRRGTFHCFILTASLAETKI